MEAGEEAALHTAHMQGMPPSFMEAADIEFQAEGKRFLAHSQMVRFHSAVINSMLEGVWAQQSVSHRLCSRL